jgi:hypothetical protein
MGIVEARIKTTRNFWVPEGCLQTADRVQCGPILSSDSTCGNGRWSTFEPDLSGLVDRVFAGCATAGDDLLGIQKCMSSSPHAAYVPLLSECLQFLRLYMLEHSSGFVQDILPPQIMPSFLHYLLLYDWFIACSE